MKIRVRFIIETSFDSKEQKTKFLTLYGDKFFAIIREAKRKKYFSLDYECLPEIRKLLMQAPNIEKLVPYLKDSLQEDNLLKVLEIAPLFNISPRDLQAFILLSLGLRKFSI